MDSRKLSLLLLKAKIDKYAALVREEGDYASWVRADFEEVQAALAQQAQPEKCAHGRRDLHVWEENDGKHSCAGARQAQPEMPTRDDDTMDAMRLRGIIAKALRGYDGPHYDLLLRCRNWLLIQWLEIQQLRKDAAVKHNSQS